MSIERFRSAAPRGVRVYDSTHEFIAENSSRQSTGFDVPGDLAGWDVADGFLLSIDGVNPHAQDEWRISVHDHEVYAVLRRHHNQETYTFDGPVWLIGTVPDIIDASVYSKPLRALTDPVEARRSQFDSLLHSTNTILDALAMLKAVAADPFSVLDWAKKKVNEI